MMKVFTTLFLWDFYNLFKDVLEKPKEPKCTGGGWVLKKSYYSQEAIFWLRRESQKKKNSKYITRFGIFLSFPCGIVNDTHRWRDAQTTARRMGPARNKEAAPFIECDGDGRDADDCVIIKIFHEFYVLNILMAFPREVFT